MDIVHLNVGSREIHVLKKVQPAACSRRLNVKHVWRMTVEEY